MADPKLRVTQKQYEQIERRRRGICIACWDFVENVDPDEEQVECDSCREFCTQGIRKAKADGNVVIVEDEKDSDM